MSTQSITESLVDAAWVAEHIQDPKVRLVEVDVNRTAYDAGHIEGAVLWNVYKDLLQPNYHVVDASALEQLLSSSGITPGSTVVFHGYAGAMGFWLLSLYRHQNIRLLDGSRKTWETGGLTMTTTVPALAPSSYHLPEPDSTIRAVRETVEAAIGAPNSRVIDARTELEYSGERFWPSLPPRGNERAGHIPGAVLVPIDKTYREDGIYKSPAELRALYANQGVTERDDIITYCTIGGRASQTWFILVHLLGFPRVRVYDASWAEWGTLPDTPITQ